MAKTFSVVIPVYRDWRRLGLCLDALAQQSLPANEFEVIVVNNDPGQDAPMMDLASNVRLLDEPKPGSYAARNTAVANSSGRFLAFTDSDCIPDTRWLENGLRHLLEAPGSRITGPVPIFREPRTGHLAYVFEYHTAFRQAEFARRGICVTANLLVSRSVFEMVGPFNDRILSGGDFAWGKAAKAAQVPISYAEDVIVRHPARESLTGIFAKRRRTAGADAIVSPISTWLYVRPRLRPPYGRVRFDRGNASMSDKAAVFGVMWAANVVAAVSFVLVRYRITKPRRT